MSDSGSIVSEGAQEVKRSAEEVAAGDRLPKLEADKRNAATQRDWAARWVIITIGVAILLLVLALWLSGQAFSLRNTPAKTEEVERTLKFSLYVFVGSLGLVVFAISNQRRKNSLEPKIEDLDFEIDLLRFPVQSVERRAEKNLLQHNKQLRRYYAQNLGENEKVFWVGIICIALGFVIICVTIYIVSQPSAKSKAIVAVLGAIGSLLSNYIAAIYLKMHAAATSNLGRFHGRLVETHQVLFANLVASRIENDKIRWDTLSKVAVGLTKPLKPEPKERDSSGLGRDAAGKSEHSRENDEEEGEGQTEYERE